MAAHYIEYDGNYHVYLVDRRGNRTRIGPRQGWPTPRDAARYADLMDRADALRSEPSHTPSGRPVAGDSAPTEGQETESELRFAWGDR